MIDIEDECDLKCRMCYFHSPFIEHKFKTHFTRMDFNIFNSLLEDLRRLKVQKIIICGKGEPFLHPWILDMISLVKLYSFYLNIFTNGIHISRKVLNELLNLKVDRLTFGLHAGDFETYSKIHPDYPEAFRHIEDLLCEIKEYKLHNKVSNPYIKIVNVIYIDNYNKIEEMVQFAQKHQVNEILFKPVQLYPEQRDLAPGPEEIKYLLEKLPKLKIVIRNKVDRYILTLLHSRGKSIVEKKAKRQKKRKCFIPWYQSVITTNRDVLFCAYNHIKLGNIYEESFSHIWFSKHFQSLRKELPCGECVGVSVYPFLDKFQKFLSWLI